MAQHATRPPADEDDGFRVDWRPAVAGLKRFWYLVVLIGLPLGAGAAYLAWTNIPAPYSARAELYMRSYTEKMAFRTNEVQAGFRTRKQTNQKLVRSRDVLTAALRDPAVSGTQTLSSKGDPVAWLQQHLSVGNSGEEFWNVGLSGEHPEELPVIVNGVVDAYMTEVVFTHKGDREDNLAKLRQALAESEDILEKKRAQREQMVKLSGNGVATMVMAEQRHDSLQQERGIIRGELARVRVDLIRRGAEKSYADSNGETFGITPVQLEAMVAELPPYQTAEASARQADNYVRRLEANLGAGSTSPDLAAARADAARRRAALGELRQTLRPQVEAELRKNFAARGDAAAGQRDETIAQLEVLRDTLERQLEEIKVEEVATGNGVIGLERMEAEIARHAARVEALSEEAERREFEIRNSTAPITVQEEATVPRTRDDGKRTKAAIAGAGGGVGFGLALAAGLGMLLTRVQRTEELEKELRIDLVGALPHLRRGGAVGGYGPGHDLLKESVDATRTVLLRKLKDGGTADAGGRVLLVSSAVASEGKTTLATHLATSLARTGRRVALVDADLRRPAVHHAFGCDVGPGLADVLRDEALPAEVEIEVEGTALRLIPAGEVCDAALCGLGTEAAGRLLADLRARFDVVIIDSPPVLPVSDALVLAERVDGVMLAVRRGVTRLKNVGIAAARFEAAGVPVLGAVTIGLDTPGGSYGYAYGGAYPYSARGAAERRRSKAEARRLPAAASRI